MNRRLALLALPGLLAGVAIVGCVPVQPTARPAPSISAACRAELGKSDAGQQLLNITDVALGADEAGAFHDVDGVPQGVHDLEAFTAGARLLGAEACP